MGNKQSQPSAPASPLPPAPPAPQQQHQLPPMQPAPPPLHQSDADEEDENVKQLGDCSTLYLSLQDCIVKNDRNWKACQKEVQALKACNERRKSSSVS